MATIPELKAEAARMGIKITSGMRKPAIEQAIAEAQAEADRFNSIIGPDDLVTVEFPNDAQAEAEPAASKPESVTREVSMPTEVRLNLAKLARLAGSMGKSAKPMASAKREQGYRWQNAPRIKGETVLSDKPLTDRQARRSHQKNNRAWGFNAS